MKKRFVSFALALIWILALSCPALAANETTSGDLASTILTSVRYKLRNTSQTPWTDAELLDYLNDGVRKTIYRTKCVEQVQQTVLDTGTSEYAISAASPFVSITDVWYQSGATTFKGLEYNKRLLKGHEDKDIAHPEYYAVEYGKVIPFPMKDTADETVTGNTIYIFFTPLQSALVSGTTIPTPGTLDESLVYYVTAHAWFSVHRPDLAMTFLGMYEAELQRYEQQHTNRPIESRWQLLVEQADLTPK
uniref:Uncharacterized protein n=1 Tax=viral metagenome TaxID=1070528 RepID=A0A6M3IDM6_9ZZZZ